MRWALAFAFLAWPVGVQAAPLKVKAADHDAFSRVVFYGQDPRDWSVLKTSAGYLLQKPDAVFETSEVYARMSKDRISDLIATDEGVFLQVDCDCHANTFFLEPDMVVVDINDGSGQDLGLTRSALTADQRAGLQAALSKRSVKPKPVDLEDLDRETELAEAVSIAEALLLEQLGRAASQGLASPREDTHLPTSNEITPMTPRNPSVESNILSTRTGLDFIDAGFEAEERQAAECVAQDHLPSLSWSHHGDFAVGLGHLRSELADATDRISADRKLALARHYLAHGFTLEAYTLLSKEASEEATIVKQLVGLIEQTDLPKPWPDTPVDCPGTSAIWHILAAPTDPIFEELGKSALRAFPELPPDLAKVVVPRLIELAYIADRPSLAADMATQLKYVLGEDGKDVDAKLPISSLAESSESAELLSIARSSDMKSPDALIAYVALQFANQEPLPSDIPELINAYVFEAKGTERYEPLERARMMAAALSGEFGRPFAALSTMTNDTEFETGLYAILANSGSDMQFLRYGSRDIPALHADLALQMSARMLDLGFDDIAFAWLPNDMAPETRLLRAKVFLKGERFDDVLSELAGQEDVEAKAIRAEAHLKMRSYARAARDFSDADLKASSLRAALIARDPSLMSEHLGDEQTQLLTTPLPSPTDEMALSKDRELIALTQKKSASLKDALAVFEKP
ncbi:MAG: hypothetical protein AAGK92_01500 [Pseudomonadota bacterium]